VPPSAGAAGRGRGLPLALKLAYTAWMAVWIPVYWIHNGPANFLWLCDAANLVLLPALWLESPLLVSSQAVGVVAIQLLWGVDFLGALAFGSHPIGGTEYMFDAASPLWLRGLSLFHLAMPPLLLWGVARLGYHRRGWWLETALVWALLPVSYYLADPARNLNWVWQPFERPQTLVAPWLYFASLFALYPLLVFLPSHLAFRFWAQRSRGRPRLLP
jgi:hypothetical protein